LDELQSGRQEDEEEFDRLGDKVRKEVKAIPIPNNRYRLLKIAFPAFNMILPFNEISKFGESSKP
jgi:hypothetical protein